MNLYKGMEIGRYGLLEATLVTAHYNKGIVHTIPEYMMYASIKIYYPKELSKRNSSGNHQYLCLAFA